MKFGTSPAARYTVNTDGTITVASPAGAGTVDVTVTGPGGVSPTSAADLFSYAAATVTGVSTEQAAGTYSAGTTVPIKVSFSEAVTVTGTPQLALNSSSGATANYVSGSGTATLLFDYTVAAGDGTAMLDYTSTTALALITARSTMRRATRPD